jgi:hypothetical protein
MHRQKRIGGARQSTTTDRGVTKPVVEPILPRRKNPTRKASAASRQDPTSPPRKRRRPNTKKPLPPSPPAVSTSTEYKDVTDPKLVTAPDPDNVVQSMRKAWEINTDHPMCLIFDAANPCRMFKRGAEHATDNDEENKEGTMAMPYLAVDFRYVSSLHWAFNRSP